MKTFFASIARDIYDSLRRPAESAGRLARPGSTNITRGLEILLSAGFLYFLASGVLSFLAQAVVIIYGGLNRFDPVRMLTQIFNAGISEAIMLFIQVVVGLPAFIVSTLVWFGIIWYIGKRMGGKALYSTFYGAMMPVHMGLLLSVGIFFSIFDSFLQVAFEIARVPSYAAGTLSLLLSIFFMPAFYAVSAYYNMTYISALHGLGRRKALTSYVIPSVAAFLFSVAFALALTFMTVYFGRFIP